MSAKTLAALLCLIGGIGLAAFGLSRSALLLALLGFVLLLMFLYLASQAMSQAMRAGQRPITPSANPASSMKDEPVRKD